MARPPEPGPHASSRIAASERAVVVLMDKGFAPFANLLNHSGSRVGLFSPNPSYFLVTDG